MHRRRFFATAFTGLGAYTLTSPAWAAQPQYTWVIVKDMHCSSCAKKIARKLYTVQGVVKVQTHLKENFAVVTPQPGISPSPRALWEAVEKAGFEPTKLQGPEGIFDDKPGA